MLSHRGASVNFRTISTGGGGGGGGTGSGTTNTPDGAPQTVGLFERIFFDDFDVDAAAGQMINSSGTGIGAYNGRWKAYSNGTGDTEHNNGGTNSVYNNSILSASNSCMVMDLHKDASGQDWGAAPYPVLDAFTGYTFNDATQLYGRVETRFYCPDPIQGFKTAWLRWAKGYDPQHGSLTSYSWPRAGETDFPEGNINSTIGAFMHWMGATSGSQQDGYGSTARYTSWHTLVDEWTPGDWKFYVDGALIGHSTGSHVPNVPMRWIAQTETVLSTSNRPIAGQHAHLNLDYVAIYRYTG